MSSITKETRRAYDAACVRLDEALAALEEAQADVVRAQDAGIAYARQYAEAYAKHGIAERLAESVAVPLKPGITGLRAIYRHEIAPAFARGNERKLMSAGANALLSAACKANVFKASADGQDHQAVA